MCIFSVPAGGREIPRGDRIWQKWGDPPFCSTFNRLKGAFLAKNRKTAKMRKFRRFSKIPKIPEFCTEKKSGKFPPRARSQEGGSRTPSQDPSQGPFPRILDFGEKPRKTEKPGVGRFSGFRSRRPGDRPPASGDGCSSRRGSEPGASGDAWRGGSH